MSAAAPVRSLVLLTAARLRMWRNSLGDALRRSRLRVLTLALTIGGVWYGIYWVLLRTFRALQLQETYGGHALHFLLLLLFMALTVMLIFSNAIILYTGLTRSREMDFLVASPTPTASIFSYKFFESTCHASWALLLLAAPLIAAFTDAAGLPAWYLPVFLLFLLTFIPVPAAVGAIGALLVGRFAPRHPIRVLIGAGVSVLAALAVWAMSLYRSGTSGGRFVGPWQLLDRIFEHLQLMDHPAVPGYWLTQGLESASNYRFADASYYYGVLLVNAVFWCTWAVVLGRVWMIPMMDATAGRSSRVKTAGGRLRTLVDAAFFFLPAGWRVLIAKDVRLFFRDPAQWSQCLVFFGLLAMYMLNMPRFAGEFKGPRILLSGLNVLAAGFITAVFTSRFVFPTLSLEGRRIWALGTAPVSRAGIVLSKYFYAVLLCAGVSTALVLLGGSRLELPPAALGFQTFSALCICLGLSAIAVGAGARWPNFEEENAAAIAGGFGGTINLLLSIAFLVTITVPPGLFVGELLLAEPSEAWSVTARSKALPIAYGYVAVVTAGTVAAALISGVRAFKRWEP
jgi:ABC-2 type transport system permease protein